MEGEYVPGNVLDSLEPEVGILTIGNLLGFGRHGESNDP